VRRVFSVTVPNVDETVSCDTFHFALDREKLRTVRRREGRYLLRTNRDGYDPATLWTFYVQLDVG